MGNARVLCRLCTLIKGGALMSDADVLSARRPRGTRADELRHGTPVQPDDLLAAGVLMIDVHNDAERVPVETRLHCL